MGGPGSNLKHDNMMIWCLCGASTTQVDSHEIVQVTLQTDKVTGGTSRREMWEGVSGC